MTWVAFLLNAQCGPMRDLGLPDYFPMFLHEFDSRERALTLGTDYTVMTIREYETYCFCCEGMMRAQLSTYEPREQWKPAWA